MKLKWWTQRKVQKLTTQQKQQRIIIAKRLRKKYSFKRGNRHYLWTDVLNTDFSGMFTLTSQYNPHNEGVYAESVMDIPYELRGRP